MLNAVREMRYEAQLHLRQVGSLTIGGQERTETRLTAIDRPVVCVFRGPNVLLLVCDVVEDVSKKGIKKSNNLSNEEPARRCGGGIL